MASQVRRCLVAGLEEFRGGRGYKGEGQNLRPLEHAQEAVGWVTSVQYLRTLDSLSVWKFYDRKSLPAGVSCWTTSNRALLLQS